MSRFSDKDFKPAVMAGKAKNVRDRIGNYLERLGRGEAGERITRAKKLREARENREASKKANIGKVHQPKPPREGTVDHIKYLAAEEGFSAKVKIAWGDPDRRVQVQLYKNGQAVRGEPFVGPDVKTVTRALRDSLAARRHNGTE